MKQRFKKMILMNDDGSRILAKKENYSFSALSLLQRWQLFLKAHSIWKIQLAFDNLYKKEYKKHFAYENKSNLEKPLVYSCSGCSGAAQMANYLAVQLDRRGVAEMSCIAGVGGNVKKLMHTAYSGRKIITIDGCPLACCKACLGNHSINADGHFELTAMGVKKRDHQDFDQKQADKILLQIQKEIRSMSFAAELSC